MTSTTQPVSLPTSGPQEAVSFTKRITSRLPSLRREQNVRKRVFEPLPQTSRERLDTSLTDTPTDTDKLVDTETLAVEEKEKTILYLAYGSNLCNETFRGVRGIKPLSQVNVLVPSLRLTFDLSGLPYTEPCFANTELRNPDNSSKSSKDRKVADYHKNRWHKGLVGVVYEVTRRDYAHIIATEGGGTSYQDILVECYVLPHADTVPSSPTSKPFKAHTLFAPLTNPDGTARATDRISRPDPSYAQPSARYLKLITDGATECDLPAEYQHYLHNIRPYTITTKRQAIGKAIFLSTWLPFILFVITMSRKLQDKKGRSPKWVGFLTAMIFKGVWLSYDGVFKNVFGNGERTIGDEVGQREEEKEATTLEIETEGLLEDARHLASTSPVKEKSTMKGWADEV